MSSHFLDSLNLKSKTFVLHRKEIMDLIITKKSILDKYTVEQLKYVKIKICFKNGEPEIFYSIDEIKWEQYDYTET